MIFYSLRTVKADNYAQAVEAVKSGEFVDDHPLCDAVLTADEIKILINDEVL